MTNFKSNIIEDRGINNKLIILDDNNNVVEDKSIPNLKIRFLGNNNKITLYASTNFTSEIILTCSSNNLVNINKTKYWLNFGTYYPMSPGSCLSIGKDCSIEHAVFVLWDEPELSISIGDNCMLSNNILFRPSDGHTIYDIKTQQILNPPQNITIGNHCWCGSGVCFLKGANVPKNSIVAMNSCYTKHSNPKNEVDGGAIFAGTPAKIIRTGVNWNRDNTYVYQNRLNSEV